MRVDHCDDEKQLVFGTLDNEPVNDYAKKVTLGSELAVSYDNVREHRKAREFTSSYFRFILTLHTILSDGVAPSGPDPLAGDFERPDNNS
jgi:hypothetical protein